MLGVIAHGSRGEKTMQRRLAIIGMAALSLMVAQTSCGQKRTSPPANAQCDLGGGKSITVDYSSPRADGRKVFGGLVPYGEVWRAGANKATTFVTTADLKVGGKDVP